MTRDMKKLATLSFDDPQNLWMELSWKERDELWTYLDWEKRIKI